MYTDQSDYASELEQRDREWAVSRKKVVERRTGKCKACDSRLEDAQAFVCDSDCREDWEKQQRADRIAGRRH